MARVCDRCGKTHVVTYMDKREGTEIDFCKDCKELFLEFIVPIPNDENPNNVDPNKMQSEEKDMTVKNKCKKKGKSKKY